MHNTLLLCTVELLLFKGVLAAPGTLANNNMRVHERIEYNHHILHDDEDSNNGSDDGNQCSGFTVSADYPSVVATNVPSLPTIFACGAQQQVQQDSVTTIYLDGGDMFDECDDTETDDLTIWQTVTATETYVYGDSTGGCGCAAPTPDALPVITSYLPAQPIVQTICPMVPAPAPPSISICTVAAPTPMAIAPAPPCNKPALAPAPVPAPAPAPAPADDGSDDGSSIPTSDDDPESAEPAPCGCTMDIDYEHPFGDDTVDWVLDTKDHTRHRWENFKDRADRAVSHVRPSHIHNRISQVLHDGRPQRSDEHRALHDYRGNTPVQDRRARARYERRLRNANYQRARYPYTYEREYYEPYVREPVRDPRRARGPARRAPELVTVRDAARRPAARGRAPQRQRGSMRDSCGAPPPPPPPPPPPMRDTCRSPRSSCDYEHQYGDDTMDFMLDTKDHTRHFYNRIKDRTKKAVSHFKPSHMHDRVDQFVHEERPERTEDHMEVHEHRGYY